MPWRSKNRLTEPIPCLLLTLIEQTALDLFECQVGLLPNQLKQPFLPLLQRRPALPLVGFGFNTSRHANRFVVDD
jgi:hypothetical protein